MSILKYLSSFAAHAALVTLTPAQLFDPRVNRLYVAREEFKTKDWWAILKAVYTRENILSNLDLFFPHTTRHSYDAPDAVQRYITEFIGRFTDDELWMLNFITFYGVSDGKAAMNRVTVSSHGSNSTVTSITKLDDGQSRDVVIGGSTWNAYLAESKTMVARWKELYELEPEKLFHYGNEHWNQNTVYFISHLLKYTTLRPYCQAEGTYFGANDLLTLMNPSSEIVVTTGTSWKIRMVTKVSKTYRQPILQILQYSTNPLDLLPYPLTVKNEYNPNLYGVELEVSTDYSVRDVIMACDEPFMLSKQDGSVSGSKRNPMELVTIPMSLKAHKQQWARFFSKLQYDNFDCTRNTTNGMHVHIGRVHFEKHNGQGVSDKGVKHIRNMAFFMNNPANKEFMLYLSERSLSSLQQYSPHFNVPLSWGKTKTLKASMDLARQVRGVVNLQKAHTVEIRLFRGIVSYASVLKNLEAVDAIFHFTRDISYSQLNIKAFFAWLFKQPTNKYAVLKKFIQQGDMDGMIAASEVNDIIFTETAPDKILKICEQKNFKLTSEHVSILNRGKKRTFVMDKETGKVKLVAPPGGKVSFLDRDLERRYR